MIQGFDFWYQIGCWTIRHPQIWQQVCDRAFGSLIKLGKLFTKKQQLDLQKSPAATN